MGGRALRGIIGVASAAWLVLVFAGSAVAGDPNRRPPDIELTAVGHEGILGPRAEALAYFSTTGSTIDPSSQYRRGSKVTFECAIDGVRARCPAGYVPVFRAGTPEIGARASEAELPGWFEGRVSIPDGLAPGPHTVTVMAADEDGQEAAPKSVGVIFDPVPPSAPVLTQKPKRRSWERKPVFRFTASDDTRLVRRSRLFTATLLRLKPTYEHYGEYDGEGVLSTWFPRCPTLLTCSTRAQAVYMAHESSYSFGEPERLVAGLYEFRVRARDAAGNRSPLTTHRFRIVPGKPR